MSEGNNEINGYFCVAIECHHIFTKENTYLLIFSASSTVCGRDIFDVSGRKNDKTPALSPNAPNIII
jgi:hypothetical protein